MNTVSLAFIVYFFYNIAEYFCCKAITFWKPCNRCPSHLIFTQFLSRSQHKKTIASDAIWRCSPYPSFIKEMVFSSTFQIDTLVNSKVELDEEESDLTAEGTSPIKHERKECSCTRFFSPCTDFEIFTSLFGYFTSTIFKHSSNAS